MAKIHLLQLADLIGAVMRSVVASVGKIRLYSEVVFSDNGERAISVTRFVVEKDKEEVFASSDIEEARIYYNELTTNL